MKLLSYLTSLLPHMDRETVLEDLQMTKTELTANVMTSYAAAAECFNVNKIASEDVISLQEQFFAAYGKPKLGRSANFIAELNSLIKNLVDNVDYTSEQLEDVMEKDIISEGLTAKKAILVRAAEQTSFCSRYLLDLLTWVYLKESIQAYKKNGQTPPDEMPPSLENNIVINIGNFGRLMSLYGISPSDYKSRLATLPDVVYNSATADSLNGVYAESKLDPLGVPLTNNFIGNPIFHLGLIVAEWQANRYKSAQDKKKMLELRLMNLKLQSEGKNDPGLEKEIQHIEERIQKYEYVMKKHEDAVS